MNPFPPESSEAKAYELGAKDALSKYLSDPIEESTPSILLIVLCALMMLLLLTTVFWRP